jgi:hypothetical protein
VSNCNDQLGWENLLGFARASAGKYDDLTGSGTATKRRKTILIGLDHQMRERRQEGHSRL